MSRRMSDIRARIAEALREQEHGTSAIPTWANERICHCGETFRSMPPGPDLADHVADVVVSLPGIAIVELPEHVMPPMTWPQTWTLYELDVERMRAFAAELLALADAAEASA